jgi:transcriptional regulator with XRE-family HTH domain
MKLADYISLEGNSATKLAEDIGVAVSTITRAAKGEITPSRGLMEAIHEHTGGAVTPNDFFGIAA